MKDILDSFETLKEIHNSLVVMLNFSLKLPGISLKFKLGDILRLIFSNKT